MTRQNAQNERRVSLQDLVDELAAELRRPVLLNGFSQREGRESRLPHRFNWRLHDRAEIAVPAVIDPTLGSSLWLSIARYPIFDDTSRKSIAALASEFAGWVASISKDQLPALPVAARPARQRRAIRREVQLHTLAADDIKEKDGK